LDLVVCALSLPHKSVRLAREEIEAASQAWPKTKGELKSGALNATQLTTLVDILFKRDAILHCFAIDVSRESQTGIDAHKAAQCNGLTQHLTPEHQPSMIAAIWKLRRDLEAMPNQLYVQCVVMRELVWRVIGEIALYFSQRQPREIAKYEWVIDAKDPQRVSTQEKWWHDTLAPLIERGSEQKPFLMVKDTEFKYKHFKRSFQLTKNQWRPDGPRVRVKGFDIGKLVTKHLTFMDSRKDILIQVIDVLAGFVRRVLAGEITDDAAIKQLGRLQICRRQGSGLQSVDVLTFSATGQKRKDISRSIRLMTRCGRSMLL
jgi:hypothetical protein